MCFMYSFTNSDFHPATNGSLMPNPMEPPSYYFLKHPTSFNALVKGLYTFPDAHITEHFRQLNPHLGGGIVLRDPHEILVAKSTVNCILNWPVMPEISVSYSFSELETLIIRYLFGTRDKI